MTQAAALKVSADESRCTLDKFLCMRHAGVFGIDSEQPKSVKTAKITDKRNKNDIELGKILVTKTCKTVVLKMGFAQRK